MSPQLTVFTLLLGCTIVSCGSEAPPSEPENIIVSDLATELLGTWETVEMEVHYQTYAGQDTTFTELIREAEWGNKYGVQPPKTLYTADGKLVRTHRLRDGQVANVINGIWKQEGDSLFVIEPNITYTYLHRMEGDRLTLTGTVDQDQDGARDDDFRAIYRLVGRTQ